MAAGEVFNQDQDELVRPFLPDRDSGIVSISHRPPDPEAQPVLVQLEDEVNASVQAVREELKVLVEKLAPVLTPKVEGEARPAVPAEGPRSKLAGSLAEWRDELLSLSNDVREVTGRLEL